MKAKRDHSAVAVLLVGCLSLQASQTLTRPGSVVGWGQMVMPFVEPVTRFTAVAAGARQSLALASNGTVVAWGSGLDGVTAVPEGLSNVVAVAAAFGHSLAIRSDPPPSIRMIPLSGGFVWLSLEGPVGRAATVWASTNSQDWEPLTTGTFSNTIMAVSDPAATNHPARFYRVVSP